MPTILFDTPIFGPVRSRRLGISLGVNLMPADKKVCSFDCLYCECGFNKGGSNGSSQMPTRAEVASKLERVLRHMRDEDELPDVITFAGNGEPTLHKDFEGIIDDTVRLRDCFSPNARICVLTNATRITKDDVAHALAKTDEAILKIDSGLQETIMRLDRPSASYDLQAIVDRVIEIQPLLGNALTIQTMFVNWEEDGKAYTNTGDQDVLPWLELLRKIAPPHLMIYTIDRETPLQSMTKASTQVLDTIADKARKIVPDVSVSY